MTAGSSVTRTAGLVVGLGVVAWLPLVDRPLGGVAVLAGATALAVAVVRALAAPGGPRQEPAGRWGPAVRGVLLVAVGGAGTLIGYVLWRYPAAAGGRGGPAYLALVLAILAGYAVVTARLRSGMALRYGTGYGAAAGVLVWTGAVPVGGLTGGWPVPARVAYGFLAVAIGLAALAAAAVRSYHATGEPRAALAGAAWGGMVGALLLFLLAVGLATGSAGRLPVDPDVAVRHTGADLVAANLGETAVPYVLALLAGPALGLFIGALGTAAGEARRVPSRL